MPDDDSSPFAAPDVRASQPPPGWYPDGRGATRWWDGLGWTDDVAAPQPIHRTTSDLTTSPFATAFTPGGPTAPSILPATASARPRHLGWWIAGSVVALIAVTGAAIGLVGKVSDTIAGAAHPGQSAGTPGYYTFTGPHGRPMTVAAPWGQTCVPVVLNVEDGVPDPVYAEVVRVVAEARAAGIDIGVETRRHTWRPSELYPAGLQNADVRFLSVFTDSDAGHLRSDGKPERDRVGWDAVLDPDGRHEHLTSLSVTLHLATLGDSTLEYRRALRKFVGWSQGISNTTQPGSALPLRATAAPDAFSATDIAAMKVMSGCSGG
jgi:Protein of unknown function (DUF2510)